MSTEFLYYLFCIIAAIVAFLIIKKVAGCLIRTIIFIVVIALLGIIYYMYFK